MRLKGEVHVQVEHDEELAQDLGTRHEAGQDASQEETNEKRFTLSKQQVVVLTQCSLYISTYSIV